ncbi:MAG: hypothetical protein MJE63_16860 [Proteobacteria bacterium]|nr:hypothetical protein [Pseudomonadota bacterium]
MKSIICFITLTLLIISQPVSANPFSAKIKKRMKPKPQKSVQKILFKGYAVIGDRHFGLVQVGDSSFEVVAGDVIKGIQIMKVTSSRLDYSMNNQSRYILLNSK